MTVPTPATPDACQHPDCGHPRDDNECHVDAGSPFFHPFVPPTPASLTTDEIARTGPISILIDRGKVTP